MRLVTAKYVPSYIDIRVYFITTDKVQGYVRKLNISDNANRGSEKRRQQKHVEISITQSQSKKETVKKTMCS